MTLSSQLLRMILSWGFITTIPLTLFIPLIVTKQAQSQTVPAAQKLVAVTNQKRVALVIGNSSYQTANELSNPANDAEDMAKALSELGFEVIKVLDANYKQMDNALERFNSKLAPGVVGVFYYAGHGIQVNGENYLIPIDAQLRNEKDVDYEALPVGKVQNAIERSGISVIILDACRNNPFSRRWYRNVRSSGLAPIEASAGSYIAFATAPGKVAEDGRGRNGTFTSYLLKYIKEPNLPIESLFKKVRLAVMKETGRQQIPWEYSSLTGEFSFNSVSTANNNSRPKPSVDNSPPPSISNLNISGTWRDSNNVVYQVIQNGTKFKFTSINQMTGRVHSWGSGTINGRDMNSEYATSLGSSGRGNGKVSADGSQITGVFYDTSIGRYSWTLYRCSNSSC